jgi:hypothetical protein
MSVLQIQPDPGAPLGGVALLRLPTNALADDHTHVQLQNAYTQLWLAPNSGEETLVQVGDGNWQADPHHFGPYAVTRDGAEAVVRIGPEIVNKLEVFAPVVLRIGGRDYDVTWPEDVAPRAGAALMGALKATAALAPATNGARLVGRKQPSDADGAAQDTPPVAAQDLAPEPDLHTETDSGGQTSGKRMALIGALVAVLVAAAAIFFVTRPEVETDPAPTAVPAPSIAAGEADCSLDALAALSGGFAATADALTGACGAVVDAEGAFRLIERGTQTGDGQAWLALGGLYDPGFTDPVFEDQLGIAPGENLPLAVEYYANAQAANVPGAAERLANACASLASRTDTLSRGARDDFCP